MGSEKEGRDWDNLDSEEAYLPSGLPAGWEELPPSLDYTPTVPRVRPEVSEPAARDLKAIPVDRDPLRLLALGTAGDRNGKAMDFELARIVELAKEVEER